MRLKRDLSKEKIGETILAYLETHNVNEVSFSAIANELEIKSQSLYNYFPNIDYLISYTGSLYYEKIRMFITERVIGFSGVDAVRKFMDGFHEYNMSHPKQSQLLFVVPNEKLSTDYLEAKEKLNNILLQILEELVASLDKRIFYSKIIRSGLIGFLILENQHEETFIDNDFEQLMTMMIQKLSEK
ncbi:MAG: TetR/AcrR family transcriptional regulator [Lactobacillaceae bacterium]|jgi:AcrR family transcriptional regulator|nr:TetR/AcrR family transcriptional regulator [Lactobacillaceae bacterium]